MKIIPKVNIYSAKRILNIQKYCDGGWFWVKYSAHPYLGCTYGCQYCYEWDKKYTPYQKSDLLDQMIKVKKNAADLLAQELATQPIDIMTLGDWQPVESKYRLSRAMLKVINELGFPVFINEKSPSILKDLDLLKKIKERNYANVGFSIITIHDDETRDIFEPKAPSVKARFEAMEKLASNNIMTGTVFMPILPFIYDNEINIKEVIQTTKEAGGKYVLDAGLTLNGYCRERYFHALKKYNPKLINQYEKIYQNQDSYQSYYKDVHNLVKKYCQQYRITNTIPRPVNHFPKQMRINKLIAERIYIKARELQLQGEASYRVLAYTKVAREIDRIDFDILTLYEKEGWDGLKRISGIGDKLATFVEGIFSNFK